MLTLCVFPIITPRPSLQSYIMHAGRGGVIYIGNTQSVSISFLFLFFFHKSSLYPIKIFAKMFLFTSLYPFISPNFERAKVNNIIPIFREPSVYTNGHGVIIIGIIGSRFATLLHHSLVQLCCKFKACGL